MYRIKFSIGTVVPCFISLMISLMSACDSVATGPSERNKEVSIIDTSSIFASNLHSTIGNTIDLDAGWMVLGDFLNDDIEQLSGALYVYRREGNSWIKETTLRPFQAEANLLFGQAADIYGNKIVVGSGSPGLEIGWPRRAGPVYLFESNGTGWNESAILTSANVAPECYGLTRQVGVNGNHFFTLANRSANLETTLCIYLQTESGLTHTKLHLDEFFNGSPIFVKVGINSEGIVVQGPRDGSLVSYTFVHDGSTWHHSFQTLRELYPDDVDRDSEFAVGDDLMVIGLPNMVHAATSTQGLAEVYSRVSGQWVLQDVLFQSPDAEPEQFGNSIAAHEDIIVVSNRRGGGRNEGSHSAEVFQHTSAGWQRVIELRAGDPAYDSTFTYDAWLPFTPSSATIAVWESTVAVGAGQSEVLPPGVYIYELAGL